MSHDQPAHDRIAAELARRVAATRESLPPVPVPPTPEEIQRRTERRATTARRLRRLLTYWLVGHPFWLLFLITAAVWSGPDHGGWTESAAASVWMGGLWVGSLFSFVMAAAATGYALWNWRSVSWPWRLSTAVPWLASAVEFVAYLIFDP